jgi:hypothetical protein
MRFVAAPEGLADPWRRMSERPGRLRSAKPSIITRHTAGLLASDPQIGLLPTGSPRAGDVMLARVDEVGTLNWLERPDGRKATLFVGDEVIVAYGARYATNVYGGIVPDDLGPCDLLACGGMAGRVVDPHLVGIRPTRLTPIGLVIDGLGQVLNIRAFAPVTPLSAPPAVHPTVIAVVGTSMDAGKTTVAGSLIRGLTAAGHRVAAAKITGTGSGKDRWLLTDAGAWPVFDMVDAGMPSTHQIPATELDAGYFGMLSALAEPHPDVIVVEIADGLAYVDNVRLLCEPLVRATIGGVIFAAVDALGAQSGYNLLSSWGLRVLAISGLVTSSPLSQREASGLIDVPVVATFDLANPDVAAALAVVGTEEAA